MTIIELFLLAVSLCFDTFAVSLSGGLSLKNTKLSKKANIMAFFGFVQAALLFAGWAAGTLFAHHIMKWDHWIAFGILAYIGGKMILENLPHRLLGRKPAQEEECSCKEKGINLLKFKTLLTLSIATSIDAIAVGISLAFISLSSFKMGIATLLTFLTTAAAAFIGLTGGEKIGCRIGSKASLIGGIMLILLGIKILAEHLL